MIWVFIDADKEFRMIGPDGSEKRTKGRVVEIGGSDSLLTREWLINRITEFLFSDSVSALSLKERYGVGFTVATLMDKCGIPLDEILWERSEDFRESITYWAQEECDDWERKQDD